MRLKVIAILLFLTFVSSFVFAQDGGGKPLPGEGTPSVTPTPTATEAATTTPLAPDEPTATATTPAEEPTEVEPTEADPTEEEPTEEQPTEENSVDADVEFPAEMLSDTGLEFEEDELVLYETFDDEEVWELIDDRDQSAIIEDGLYIMETEYNDSNNIPFAGLNNSSHGDVVMQVTTEQLSREPNNGYGFICRADEDNNLDGYHLWISGDGYATIFLYEDEGDSFVSLADWISSSTINQGTEVNVITAVCVGEYLGLFVNGDLLVEAEDDTYSEGVAGFSVMTFIEDTNIEIAFDDLYIWEVSASQVEEDPIDISSSDFDPDDAADEVADTLEQGDVEIELGDLLLGDDFSEEGDWTLNRGDMDRRIEDGLMIFDGGVEETLDFFFWSYNEDEDEHDDVVIRVDAAFVAGEDVEYGLMCRSTEASDGYTFAIDSNGNYSISHWVGTEYTVLTSGDSDAINTDEEDVNTIYAVCVGEYLALYINNELIDEVDDDTFEEGITNLFVWQHTEDSLTVSFDNIYIWEAND